MMVVPRDYKMVGPSDWGLDNVLQCEGVFYWLYKATFPLFMLAGPRRLWPALTFPLGSL